MAPHKSLKEVAKSNPTLLGDPVSLKAETSDTSPTENDRPFSQKPPSSSTQHKKKHNRSSPAVQDVKQLAPTEQDVDFDQSPQSQHVTLQPAEKHDKTLKDIAIENVGEAQKGNKTMLGDPVSLKAETVERDPVKDDESKEDGTGRSGATPGKGRSSKL